jgi:hypothetical protein
MSNFIEAKLGMKTLASSLPSRTCVKRYFLALDEVGFDLVFGRLRELHRHMDWQRIKILYRKEKSEVGKLEATSKPPDIVFSRKLQSITRRGATEMRAANIKS